MHGCTPSPKSMLMLLWPRACALQVLEMASKYQREQPSPSAVPASSSGGVDYAVAWSADDVTAGDDISDCASFDGGAPSGALRVGVQPEAPIEVSTPVEPALLVSSISPLARKKAMAHEVRAGAWDARSGPTPTIKKVDDALGRKRVAACQVRG